MTASQVDPAALFARRITPSPSEVAAIHEQRAAALATKLAALPEGSPERAQAELDRATDPSNRGARTALRREELARARREFGEL